jgi:hypothetical protein
LAFIGFKIVLHTTGGLYRQEEEEEFFKQTLLAKIKNVYLLHL